MWEFEHSVEAKARRAFVWSFWTDVSNWAFDTSVEWVRLDGPFASGTKGVTKSPGSEPVDWVLTEVQAEKEATVEFSLAEAVLRFHWRFEDIPEGGTRITQRATFTGADTINFVKQIAPEFEKGIPDGMRKLADEAMLAQERQRNIASAISPNNRAACLTNR